MKITDVPCSCACGWSGTASDCDPDVSGDARLGTLGCPVCLTPVTCMEQLAALFTKPELEIIQMLMCAFDAFMDLPSICFGDAKSFINAIVAAQNTVVCRATRGKQIGKEK